METKKLEEKDVLGERERLKTIEGSTIKGTHLQQRKSEGSEDTEDKRGRLWRGGTVQRLVSSSSPSQSESSEKSKSEKEYLRLGGEKCFGILRSLGGFLSFSLIHPYLFCFRFLFIIISNNIRLSCHATPRHS